MKRNILLLIAWFGLVSLACNLTNPSAAPPTIVPRVTAPPTAPPQPTLGYATTVPGAQVEPTAAVLERSVEMELLNLMDQVEADRLMFHIDSLVSFRTRHVNSSQTSLDEGIGAAYNYIMDHFLALQAQAPQNFNVFPDGHEFEITWNGITSRQRNAVAILQGTDVGAGTIVVGAHYDSRTNDINDATNPAPGAVDNGSGVAAVLELARILSRYPQRATIIFILFSAEEQGRYGSQAFVEDYLKFYDLPTDNTFMINLDTIGSWNSSDGLINDRDIRLFSAPPNDSPSRQLARTLHFIGYNHNLPLNVVLYDGEDREGRWGDHMSFSAQNYPAVRFIEALEDNYNREGRDTLDGVEPAYLVKSTQTTLGIILSLSGGPRPPRNYTLRDHGDGTQSLIWEPVPDAASYIVALRREGSLGVNQHFVVTEAGTAPWDKWGNYEAVSIAAVDSSGLIGPLSDEYRIP